MKKLLLVFALIDFASARVDRLNLDEALIALNLTRFLSELQKAGLAHFLWKPGHKLTVFAPQNEGFGGLKLDQQLLKYHLAEEEWALNGLQNEQLIQSKQTGAALRINHYDTVTTVSGVPVVKKDIKAKNGMIQIVSGLLSPLPSGNIMDTVRDLGNCKQFTQIIESAGFGNSLSFSDPLTLLIPTDAAFEHLPGQFLNKLQGELKAMGALVQYHVLNGTYYKEGLKGKLENIGGEKLIFASSHDYDIIEVNDGNARVLRSFPATNGVVHLIDALLFPASPKQFVFQKYSQNVL